MGKLYDEISDDLFGYRSGKHLVFHTVISPTEINVIRVLHHSMGIKTGIPRRS